jgi:tRNA G18 (ribose-2'-O)-methylase SpoU
MTLIVLMHNIRSAHNVGSILRTADGCGVEKVWLSGYTPLPATQETPYLTRAHKDIAKTALGAEQNLVWEYHEDFEALVQQLKQEGFAMVALEQSPQSIDYEQFQPTEKVALVVGNEVDGVSKEVLALCDAILEIPMRGTKNSLNVSVAFGIASFQIKSTMEKEKRKNYEKNKSRFF